MAQVRARRALTALASAALVVSLSPAVVSAAAVTRYTDHYADAGCEGPVVGGYVSVYLSSSEAFGDFAVVDIWLDPAVAYEDPQSATGEADSVTLDEASGVVLGATVAMTGADGAPLGDAHVTATMGPDGDPFSLSSPGQSNHHYATEGTIQPLVGSATIAFGAVTGELSCGGEAGDVSVFEANPTAFVSSDAGVTIDCFWASEEAVAGLYATADEAGLFADAFLETPGHELFLAGSAGGSLTATALDLSIPLIDGATGDPGSAAANGAFTPIGDPVTSVLVRQNGRTKVVEQALDPAGSVTFSSGESFSLDAEHCHAETFARHTVFTSPSGPKPGVAPANDLPTGAIALKVGAKLNAMTTSTALDAEVPVETCPEGPRDDLGHTLWYRIAGTGGPVTVDTAGSDFDTVVAVYAEDDPGLTEVGCNDDVLAEPVGISYQAALTVETIAGASYLVQAGGYRLPYGGDAESGRLRLAIR